MKHTLFLISSLLLLVIAGCKKPDLDIGDNPWDQDSDIPVVVIDTIYIDGLGSTRIYYHVNEEYVPPPYDMVWAYAYRNGRWINQALVSKGYLVDAFPVSGETYRYGIAFTPSGGGRTKRFGPFWYSVP